MDLLDVHQSFELLFVTKKAEKVHYSFINIVFLIFILLSFLEIALEENDKRLRVNVLCSKSGDTVPEKVVCNLRRRETFFD